MDLTIGVDIGGTKVAAGVVDVDGKILFAAKRETPASDPEATEDVIAALVLELAERVDQVHAVGIGRGASTSGRRSGSPPRYILTPSAPRCCSRRPWPGATSRSRPTSRSG